MRSSMALVIVLCTSSCRQILGIDPGTVSGDANEPHDSGTDGDVDAPGDATAMTDSSIDAPALGPWTNITAVPGLNQGDREPTLTGDMLEMYFTRNGNIFVVTRADLASAWSTPQVAAFSNAGENHSPEISRDGLVVAFSSDRGAGGPQLDIYVSARSSRTSAWGSPVPFVDVNHASADDRPGSATLDGARVMLASNRTAISGDIYESVRTGALGTPYGQPARQPLSSLQSEDGAPALSDDGLTLYYSSGPSPNNLDLYVATRSSLTEMFTAGTAVAELDGGDLNSDPWVSSDGRVIYFSSDRSSNDVRIYQASR